MPLATPFPVKIRNALFVFAASLALVGAGGICRAGAGVTVSSATVYLWVQAGVFGSNGARFWPSLAGTGYPTVVIAPGLPAAGVDYYTYNSPGGVIPWSDGTLGDSQFVVYHPADQTYWLAQAFSTSGSNIVASGGGAPVSGFGMLGDGTPEGFCGGGGRAAPVYTEIAILSPISPPATTLTASPTSITLGQSVVLTATTLSPASSLFAQAIDNSSDGSFWILGSTVPGASWTGGPAAKNTLVWTFTPTSPGPWHFRAAGTDAVGVSNSPEVVVNVDRIPATFGISPVSFTYNGSNQGPIITPSPIGASYSTMGTPSAATAGGYSVTATANGNFSGASEATAWSIGKATPTVTWPSPAAIPYGTPLSSEQLNATASVPGSFIYSPAAGTILGAGAGQPLSVNFIPADTTDYNSVTAGAAIQVDGPLPPSASISGTPSIGTAPLTATISWATTNASSALVAGVGVASSNLSGSQSVTLSVPGTYFYTLMANSPSAQANRSAQVVVNAPLYALTTVAIGNGTVTPGGTYRADSVIPVTATPGANANFINWTGSLASTANPLAVTMTGDMTLYATFVSLQPQTIAFSLPATATYPGPAITLAATASSGLPVSFSLASGPASVQGNQLSFTGPGPVVVRATQAGNGQWLPAAPVDAAIQVNPFAIIGRIRFSASGNDARVLNKNAPAGSGFIWTDSAGVGSSPWPSFDNPQTETPVQQNTNLPAVPIAPASGN
jgi:hypothetical protein